MTFYARRAKRAQIGLLAVFAAFAVDTTAAAQYSMRRTPDLVELEDAAHGIVVAIAPPAGNLTREMTVKGHNVLGPLGIPFLGPWANRLDEQAFYANGKRYALNMGLGNVRGAHPIHGFLSAAVWEVVEAKADSESAWVTSRLEFFKQPDWMAQFPFAHTIEMTHRLRGGVLDITVALHNMSAAPMPVAIGFHPYFQLTDAPRDAWTIALGARTEWTLADDKIPTGETRPIERRFPDPRAAVLRDHDLDHVFGDLIRDASGRATMSVVGRSQKIDIAFGPNYRAAVVYAPAGRDFICFEPMAGITDALNLAQRNLYADLQYIPAGGTWKETFWVRPSGF
jgi:aldose 1-epimerase